MLDLISNSLLNDALIYDVPLALPLNLTRGGVPCP